MKKYITSHFMKGLITTIFVLMFGFWLSLFISDKANAKEENQNIDVSSSDDSLEIKLLDEEEVIQKGQAPVVPTLNHFAGGSWDFGSMSSSRRSYGYNYETRYGGIVLTNLWGYDDNGDYDCDLYAEISIPETYDGKTVVGIASNFYGYVRWDWYGDVYSSVYFNYIKLPSTIKYIEDNAFIPGSYAGAYSNTKYDLSDVTN